MFDVRFFLSLFIGSQGGSATGTPPSPPGKYRFLLLMTDNT